jgi:hypothetical protein
VVTTALPIGMNVFGRLKALKSSAYAGLISLKPGAARAEDRAGLHHGVEEITRHLRRRGVPFDLSPAFGQWSLRPAVQRIAQHCAELGHRRGDIAGRGENPEVGPTHHRRHPRGVPVSLTVRRGAAVIVARRASQSQYHHEAGAEQPAGPFSHDTLLL